MEIKLENVLCIVLSELFTAVSEWTAFENEKYLFQVLMFYFSRIKSLGISLTLESFTYFLLKLPTLSGSANYIRNFSGQAKLSVRSCAVNNNSCARRLHDYKPNNSCQTHKCCLVDVKDFFSQF